MWDTTFWLLHWGLQYIWCPGVMVWLEYSRSGDHPMVQARRLLYRWQQDSLKRANCSIAPWTVASVKVQMRAVDVTATHNGPKQAVASCSGSRRYTCGIFFFAAYTRTCIIQSVSVSRLYKHLIHRKGRRPSVYESLVRTKYSGFTLALCLTAVLRWWNWWALYDHYVWSDNGLIPPFVCVEVAQQRVREYIYTAADTPQTCQAKEVEPRSVHLWDLCRNQRKEQTILLVQRITCLFSTHTIIYTVILEIFVSD